MISFILLVIVYFLPAILAYGRGIPSAGKILVASTLVNWSIIGWVLTMFIAATKE